MPTQHAFDVIASPPKKVEGGGCAIFGSERFLKKLAAKSLAESLADEDAEFGSNQFDGETVEWADVSDELSSLSLFGGSGPRIAIVDHADGFVKKYRDRIETYLEHPPNNALLVLIVGTWAANTRLYKRLDKSGFQVNCDPPKSGKKRNDKKIVDWLTQRAKKEYKTKLSKAGAATLIELTECEFGRMDQELNKLSLYVDDDGSLDESKLREIVGGWPMQTMWQAIDKATEGDAGSALQLINQLIQSGQHPLAMFGQISWSLRRYAEAAEIVARQQRARTRIDLNGALKQAGFRQWGGELEGATNRLRQIGRDRVYNIYRWILETELALKGSHSKDARAHLALETLITRLAKELGPLAAPTA